MLHECLKKKKKKVQYVFVGHPWRPIAIYKKTNILSRVHHDAFTVLSTAFLFTGEVLGELYTAVQFCYLSEMHYIYHIVGLH